MKEWNDVFHFLFCFVENVKFSSITEERGNSFRMRMMNIIFESWSFMKQWGSSSAIRLLIIRNWSPGGGLVVRLLPPFLLRCDRATRKGKRENKKWDALINKRFVTSIWVKETLKMNNALASLRIFSPGIAILLTVSKNKIHRHCYSASIYFSVYPSQFICQVFTK